MKTAQMGDKVQVGFIGKFEDGTPFGATTPNRYLELTIGKGDMVSGFENGLIGMAVGQQKKIKVPPEDGYGGWRKDLLIKINKEEFPKNMEPKIGVVVRVKGDNEDMKPLRVTDIKEDSVIMDANPPLAGKTLIFEIKLINILESSPN